MSIGEIDSPKRRDDWRTRLRQDALQRRPPGLADVQERQYFVLSHGNDPRVETDGRDDGSTSTTMSARPLFMEEGILSGFHRSETRSVPVRSVSVSKKASRGNAVTLALQPGTDRHLQPRFDPDLIDAHIDLSGSFRPQTECDEEASFMRKALLLSGALLMTNTQDLTYRAQQSATSVREDTTLTITITGPAQLTSDLGKKLPVRHIEAVRTARRTVTPAENGASRIDLHVDSATVKGTADSPFEYTMHQSSPPDADPVRQFAWGFATGPRQFTLGPKGEYATPESADGQAELKGIIVDAPVRLPAHAVNVGEEWTTEWTGAPRKADHLAFHYRQTARLEGIEQSPTPRARIGFKTTGAIESPSAKAQGDQSVDATGTILLDLQSGAVVGSNSSGSISIDVKSAGLKIVFAYTSKYSID